MGDEIVRLVLICAGLVTSTDRDNSILITKICQFTAIYFNFALCWGSVVMLTSLNYSLVLSPFIEKSMI